MSESKFTPGPWYADIGGQIWRRNPDELYENGGGVAGERPLASTYRGWNEERETGYPKEANAHLIAAAPEIYEALEDLLYQARFFEDQGGWDFEQARAALAKARGERAMSEAPKKIWWRMDGPLIGWAELEENSHPDDIPYIRADIVDELVKALNTANDLMKLNIAVQEHIQSVLDAMKEEK